MAITKAVEFHMENRRPVDYIVDTREELDLLPTTTKKGTGACEGWAPVHAGSTAICSNGGTGVTYYMLFGEDGGNWVEL